MIFNVQHKLISYKTNNLIGVDLLKAAHSLLSHIFKGRTRQLFVTNIINRPERGRVNHSISAVQFHNEGVYLHYVVDTCCSAVGCDKHMVMKGDGYVKTTRY